MYTVLPVAIAVHELALGVSAVPQEKNADAISSTEPDSTVGTEVVPILSRFRA
jgi:hypothetical protein